MTATSRCFCYALARTGSREEAEDIASQVFVKALRIAASTTAQTRPMALPDNPQHRLRPHSPNARRLAVALDDTHRQIEDERLTSPTWRSWTPRPAGATNERSSSSVTCAALDGRDRWRGARARPFTSCSFAAANLRRALQA
jgi:hypothetical protein